MADVIQKRLTEHVYDGCGYGLQYNFSDDGYGNVEEDIVIRIANNGYYTNLSLKQLNEENDGLLLKVLKGVNNGNIQTET